MIPANALNIGYDNLSKMANFGEYGSSEMRFSIQGLEKGGIMRYNVCSKSVYIRFNIDIDIDYWTIESLDLIQEYLLKMFVA